MGNTRSRWALLAILTLLGPTSEGYRFDSHLKQMVESQWFAEALQQGAIPLGLWEVPVKKGSVTSCYGPRKLLGKFHDFHHGVDFGVPVNTPVRATAPGRVVWAGNAGCAGRSLIVKHSVGGSATAYSIYRHLKDYRAKKGQTVESGQLIALSGASGTRLLRGQKNSRRGCITAPHLHFEVRVLKPEVPAVVIEEDLVKKKGQISELLYPTNPVSFLPQIKDRCS
ncbi:MAG: M23 family metallopeptidase [Oligoflexia bacterium]|nr:M23 family metallopeptidase [Oligoflexia bacterium]